MTEDEFRANHPLPGDKVWLKPMTYRGLTSTERFVTVSLAGGRWAAIAL